MTPLGSSTTAGPTIADISRSQALDRLDAGRKIGPVPDTSVTARLLDHAPQGRPIRQRAEVEHLAAAIWVWAPSKVAGGRPRFTGEKLWSFPANPDGSAGVPAI
jgi:hypothetical protein